MFIIALIAGLVFGVGLAYFIVSIWVDKSNNKGDSKGDFKHFSNTPINMYEQLDKQHRKVELKYKGR